jgi:hypothetical protein
LPWDSPSLWQRNFRTHALKLPCAIVPVAQPPQKNENESKPRLTLQRRLPTAQIWVFRRLSVNKTGPCYIISRPDIDTDDTVSTSLHQQNTSATEIEMATSGKMEFGNSTSVRLCQENNQMNTKQAKKKKKSNSSNTPTNKKSLFFYERGFPSKGNPSYMGKNLARSDANRSNRTNCASAARRGLAAADPYDRCSCSNTNFRADINSINKPRVTGVSAPPGLSVVRHISR